jgi:molybdenum cofactor biosynthesis enzyme MoaA
MAATRLIRKSIDHTDYCYNRQLDIIYTRDYECRPTYNRTQVDTPVDLCIELTTYCNSACHNCFSRSVYGQRGRHMPADAVISLVRACRSEIIRVCITGGEPLLHPQIERVLHMPAIFPDCGFVLSTNGTIRPELDDVLVDQSWLVAISLHGRANAHNIYTAADSFDRAVSSINRLSSRTIVHIYSVLHSGMTMDDILWLFKLRDESGASFLRFITPRPFGRYTPFDSCRLLEMIASLLDEKSGIKTASSRTRFLSADGQLRMTN